MVLAKPRGHQSARAGRADRAEAGKRSPRSTERRDRRARASSTCGSTTRAGATSCATILAEGDDYGRSTIGAGRDGQRRICLGQSDRADAHGPLPRRGGRRRAGQPARISPGYRVTREYYVNDAGGQVDTLARSAHLRYREALGEDIGEIPEGLYPGDYLMPVGQALAAEYRRPLRRRARERMAGAVPREGGRGDDGADQRRSRAARHPSRPVRVRSRAAGARASRARPRLSCARKGLVYDGVLEAPKGEDARRLGAGRADRCSARPSSATTRTGRCKKSDGSWTYFGADARLSLAEGARTPTS